MKRKKVYVFLPIEVEVYAKNGEIVVGSILNPIHTTVQIAFDNGFYVSTKVGANVVFTALAEIASVFRSNPRIDGDFES